MFQNKPIIGITLDYSETKNYSNYPWYALRKDYSDSITKMGGIPVFISYEYSLLDDLISLIDGVIVPGGDYDIAPKHYGVSEIYSNTVINETRNNFDFAVIKKALEYDVPLLGICAGMQAMAVLDGGGIYQDITQDLNTSVKHVKSSLDNASNKEERPTLPRHKVEVKTNTLLYDIVKHTRIDVNSAHRQAVSNVGSNTIISSHAEDGVIEAIEMKNNKFALGVEWHPEFLTSNEDETIFRYFVDIATKHGQSKDSQKS